MTEMANRSLTANDIKAILELNLKRDEGLSLELYTDTVGKLTIGYGHNLSDLGIPLYVATDLLRHDIDVITKEVDITLPELKEKPWQVRIALYNMAFNMGINRLLEFKKMLAAIEVDDFKEAANQALQSKWAKQVGTRAERIAVLFREAATS